MRAAAAGLVGLWVGHLGAEGQVEGEELAVGVQLLHRHRVAGESPGESAKAGEPVRFRIASAKLCQ